jgi:circadian clock protein KaiC
VDSKRAHTGIGGLDEILRGGLPRNRVYLIEGLSGTGKTTLALQFLLQGIKDGERGLYVPLSETLDEVQEVAVSHGWDISGLDIFELSGAQNLTSSDNQNSIFRTSNIELTETETILFAQIEASQPDRLVIDSLSEVQLLAVEPWVFRLHLLRLKQFLAARGIMALFLDDLSIIDARSQPQSIVHGVIRLTYEIPEYGSFRRRLCVKKLRGVPFIEGDHDMAIRHDGMEVYPRLVAADLGQPVTPDYTITSGISELDELLGGGLDRGTTNLIIGPAGVGKSTAAMQFALHAADQGLRVELYIFDERVETMLRRWDGLGRDIRPYLERSAITMRHVDPAELTAGEFACRVRRVVEEDGVKVLIIDSLTGYQQAMVGERTLMLQLHELQTYLGNHGVTTILVNAQHGLFVTSPAAHVDVSYLADTVLLLRCYEFRGTIRKALSVFKRRTGRHQTAIRDFEIGPGGIIVGRPRAEFQEVLAGSPTYISAENSYGSGAP